jgi:hypothetical protein
VGFGTIKIDDDTYKEFNNISVYDIIRNTLFKNNDILSSILTE